MEGHRRRRPPPPPHRSGLSAKRPLSRQTGGMDDPETVVDALRLLRSEGYEIEFQLIDGHLQCNADDRACPASDAIVERVYRFEGASDPGDEMVVFGLRDPDLGPAGRAGLGVRPGRRPRPARAPRRAAARFGT